jgi:hypothetical protein
MLYRRSPADKADIPALVELFVRVGRMRILSSPMVVESAELVARRIIDAYLEPNKNFLDYGRWRIAGESICVISARPAAQNSCGLARNSETRCELENCSELAVSGACLNYCMWSSRIKLGPILWVIVTRWASAD